MAARIGRDAICTWLTLSDPLRPCHRNAPLTSAPSDTDTPKDSGPLKDKGLVRVLLPLPLAEPFSYRPGPAAPLAPGDIVEVPFGTSVLLGVVWDGAAEPTGRASCRERGLQVGEIRVVAGYIKNQNNTKT